MTAIKCHAEPARPFKQDFRPLRPFVGCNGLNWLHTSVMKRLPLFLLTLSLAAQDPQALFQAAMSKMQQAGQLAQQGKFGPVNELLLAAAAEMDRAIEAAP